MDEEVIAQKILMACDKHELRCEDKETIINWADHAILEYGLLKNIEMDLVEICGIRDGEVLFQLTETGKQHASEIFKK